MSEVRQYDPERDGNLIMGFEIDPEEFERQCGVEAIRKWAFSKGLLPGNQVNASKKPEVGKG